MYVCMYVHVCVCTVPYIVRYIVTFTSQISKFNVSSWRCQISEGEVRISVFSPCICIKCNLSQQVVRDLRKVPRGIACSRVWFNRGKRRSSRHGPLARANRCRWKKSWLRRPALLNFRGSRFVVFQPKKSSCGGLSVQIGIGSWFEVEKP